MILDQVECSFSLYLLEFSQSYRIELANAFHPSHCAFEIEYYLPFYYIEI